jgi:hypothetical protein
MTVKELIEELKKLDENLVVVCENPEDTDEPSPHIRIFEFDSNYYTGTAFITLPKNVPYVVL